METTDALFLAVTSTGNGKNQTVFFTRPFFMQSSWSGICTLSARLCCFVTYTAILESKTPFSTVATLRIMSRKAASRTHRLGLYLSFAVRETISSVSKIRGSESKSARSRQHVLSSSKKWTLWTHLHLSAVFLGRNGTHKQNLKTKLWDSVRTTILLPTGSRGSFTWVLQSIIVSEIPSCKSCTVTCLVSSQSCSSYRAKFWMSFTMNS